MADDAEADAQWREQLPPLVRAAESGSVSEVQRLLSSGVSVEQADEVGWTALHAAAVRGHAEIVHLLLAAGADPNKSYGDDGVSPLLNAAGPGTAETVRALLDAGADPHELHDGYPDSALHRAAEFDEPDIALLLLHAGVPPDQLDNEGCTPLFTAAQAGATRVARILIDAGADPEATCEGETPAEAAREFGHQELARLIEESVRRNR